MKKIILGIFTFIFLLLAFFSLATFSNFWNLKTNSQTFIENSFTGAQSDENYNQKIIQDLEKINKKAKKINFLFPEISKLSATTNTLAQEFLQEDINYLIILQNSDELRATGGFMGSYSKYSIQNSLIKELKIEDIYSPSGQYQGYKDAPPGLNEYLSSGEGMKLPDANWYPDLPKSAQNILSFFEEIENKKYDGIIFINLELIEKVLESTGELYLPDYKVHINSDNFSTLAREGRENFFPGSQEKSNFLNASLNIIQIELKKIAKENPQKLLSILENAIKEKDVQAYSQNPEIQTIFENYQLAGLLENPNNNRYYHLVESNVGINKANKNIDRSIDVQIKEKDYQQEAIVTISYQNHNKKDQKFTDNPFLDEAKHMSYINYQRFFTNPENEIQTIKINGQEIDKENYQLRLISNTKNQSFREISTLVTVPEEETTNIEITLLETQKFKNNKEIYIQKQSGVNLIPININFLGENKNLELNSDQKIKF